jgi:16S rRNA (guanine1207-N2)-methyltransferase
MVIAAVANDEALSREADLKLLAGNLVISGTIAACSDPARLHVRCGARPGQATRALVISPNAGRHSRTARRFRVDRVDAASAMLAEALPNDLRSRGRLRRRLGYLSLQVLARCPNVASLTSTKPTSSLALADRNCGRAPPIAATGMTSPAANADAIVCNPPPMRWPRRPSGIAVPSSLLLPLH